MAEIARSVAARYPEVFRRNRYSELAAAFRRRSAEGKFTRLTPETALLVAAALEAFAPKPEPVQLHQSPDDRLRVDVYSTGSAVYRLRRDGGIAEVVAWARSTLVARTAYEKLVEQYPGESFMQKRRSWVENP
jgi:hypothetical protein